MPLDGPVGSMSFTMTGGAAGAVTVVNGGVIPNGTYTIQLIQRQDGNTVYVLTPVGNLSQQGAVHFPGLNE